MILLESPTDFDQFAHDARHLLAQRIPPDGVLWQGTAAGGTLFADALDRTAPRDAVRLPKKLIERARTVSHHRDESRWIVIYRLLWRVGIEKDRGLLDEASDPDVRRFEVMEKEVRFDAHKAKAFVRFRKIDDESGERYLAWHKPEHRILPIVAPFFASRFGVMRWTIFTPSQSADWDGSKLRLGPGVPEDPHEGRDELESLWKTYYANIFNPARIKVGAMLKEMPRRYWSTMPETQLIDELLQGAPESVLKMMASNKDEPGAEAFLPPAKHRSLPQLRQAAKECQGCELYENATHVVFGEGPKKARLMFVGEQPGDEEDLAGKPFVGPAGRLFNEALDEAGIERKDTYVTNAVKHFRFEMRGPRRIHRKPTRSHVRACGPWLRCEIDAVQPTLVVALGSTAAQAFHGSGFRVTHDRGRVIESTTHGVPVLATVHPSSILRTPNDAREEAYKAFVEDLALARQVLGN